MNEIQQMSKTQEEKMKDEINFLKNLLDENQLNKYSHYLSGTPIEYS